MKIYPKSFWQKWSFVKSIPARGPENRKREFRDEVAAADRYPGVNVTKIIITIFNNFRQFSAKKQ
jgi:hypothetical protein